MRTEFRWKHHNVFSMINSINKDLKRLGVRPELRLELTDNTLKAFGLTLTRNDINDIGDLVHFALVILFVIKDAEARYIQDMFHRLAKEIGNSFWRSEYNE